MRLSVVIVSYNVRHFLEQALCAVEKAMAGLDVEVFVVDNASADDSVAMVRQRFPWVRLIANLENTGFSVANNQAMRLATGDHILLLNPDTVVAEDTFHRCLSFMDAHPDAGGLGVRMIDGGGNFLPESKRGFPTPFVAFCKAFGLSRLFPRSAFFNRYHQGYLPELSTSRVDVLAGAFMWMRREALDKAGLLDERFFMYGEDIDLSYRIRQAGFENYYFPDVTIIHYKGESTRKGTLNYIRIFYQAMILFAEKHFHGPQRAAYIFFIRLAVYVRAGLSLGRSLASRAWLLVADGLLLFLTLIAIKDFWAGYYFNDPDYYPPQFDYINAPLYAVIWLGTLFLSGAYDRRYDLWTAARGIVMGGLFVAAVYGFLDPSYRTSRAIILISTVAILAELLLLRMVAHYLRFGRLIPAHRPDARLLLVGSEAECQRAEDLLRRMDRRKNRIGWLSMDGAGGEAAFLGSIRELDQVVQAFEVNEIIFCARDVPYDQMMRWMNLLGPGMDYKILTEGADSIIGSASAARSGELYTLDVPFQLADPVQRRHKRMLDLLAALVLLLAAPLLMWRQRRKAGFLWNVLRLWTGARTLVAYPVGQVRLPPLRPGILSPEDGPGASRLEARSLQHLWYVYARDYRVGWDWRIFIHNLTRLDRP